jgi:hypothetical protein
MRRFLVGVGVRIALSSTVALAQEFVPGRGYLGEVPSRQSWYFNVWEPEPGVRCYTYGNSISCLRKD